MMEAELLRAAFDRGILPSALEAEPNAARLLQALELTGGLDGE